MKEKLFTFFTSRNALILTGAVIGVSGSLLQFFGNPKNMGICAACFERDIAGALGLHRATTVQYLRPEIMAFVLGALIAALIFGEFCARGGSSPLIRFVLGFFAMIGALAFLGCPWRAWFRLAGGDINGLFGLIGLAGGVWVGTLFLKKGYSLGRSTKTKAFGGMIFPLMMVVLLIFAIVKPLFGSDGNGPIFSSVSGPGSLHAPILASIIAGLLIGFLAQRTRFCTVGAFRDVLLMRDFHLMSGVLALGLSAFVMNIVLGQFSPGFRAMPISHSNVFWSILAMVLAGLAYSLAGGCAGRQLFLSGEGDTDAAIFVIGMISGAAFAHNFGLAGTPDSITDGAIKVGGISTAGMIAVICGLIICCAIGFSQRDKWKQEAK